MIRNIDMSLFLPLRVCLSQSSSPRNNTDQYEDSDVVEIPPLNKKTSH